MPPLEFKIEGEKEGHKERERERKKEILRIFIFSLNITSCLNLGKTKRNEMDSLEKQYKICKRKSWKASEIGYLK